MRIQEDIKILVPAEKLWDILWKQYGQVCDWASTVNNSEDRQVQGNINGGRTCHSTWGEISEIVESVDPENMSYSYRADGLPKIMKSAQNTWKITSLETNASQVALDLEIEFATIPRILMGWMIVPKMKKDMKQTLLDLKYYAETGNQTKIKIESDKKFNTKLKKVS